MVSFRIQTLLVYVLTTNCVVEGITSYELSLAVYNTLYIKEEFRERKQYSLS